MEFDHYEERKAELLYLENLEDPEDPVQADREPFLPHPELRETVPNVALYSVLYKLPVNYRPKSVPPRTSIIDEQLTATVEFFDKCVPNQPGYSSSVAAVTILPDASRVSRAWKKWYSCSLRLRKLRFIRKQLKILRKNEGIEPRQDVLPKTISVARSPYQRRASMANEIEALLDSYEGPRTPIQSTEMRRNSILSSKPLATLHEFDSKIDDDDFGDDDDDDDDSCIVPKDLMCDTDSDPQFNTQKDEVIAQDSKTNEGLPPVTVTAEAQAPFEQDKQEAISNTSAAGADPVQIDRSSDRKNEPKDENEVEDDGSDSSSEIVVPRRKFNFENDTSSSTRVRSSRQHEDEDEHTAQMRFKSYGIEKEAHLDHFLENDGMEQAAVYCREYARSSARCFCSSICLRFASIERLEELERETEIDFQEASLALLEAKDAIRHSLMVEDQLSINTFSVRVSRELSILVDELDLSLKDLEDDPPLDGMSEIRPNEGMKKKNPRAISSERQWQVAAEIVKDTGSPRSGGRRVSIAEPKRLPSGRWKVPSWRLLLQKLVRKGKTANESVLKRAASTSGLILNHVVADATYAVVTFTSRQAAIAARQCLADGSGMDRWAEIEDLPIPPLADSPAWNLLWCRGMCRPVTLTLNDYQKRMRKYL